MDFIKESLNLLINTHEKSHEKELCLRNTRALRVSSLRLDCSLVLKFPVVKKHLSASTEDIGIPSRALYSFSKI